MKNMTVDSKGDRFLELQMVKVPDLAERSSVKSEDACRSQCLENCTCIAYSYDPGIGCMSWSGNLIDIQQFPSGGIDLYIRLANSGFGMAIVVICPSIVVVFLDPLSRLWTKTVDIILFFPL